jgi:hypothetical protein
MTTAKNVMTLPAIYQRLRPAAIEEDGLSPFDFSKFSSVGSAREAETVA